MFQQQPEQGADGQGSQVPGNSRHPARPEYQHAQADQADQAVGELQAGQCLQQQAQLFHVVVRLAERAQAEQVLELQGGDDDADARGEAQGHRIGDELDQAAGAQQAQGDQDQPGHQGAQQQAAEAELLGDRQQDHHEGRGGAGDVEARAAAQGDQRGADQHRIEAMLWRHAHRNRQGHGQRNGDDADGDAGAQIAAQAFPAITGAQALAPGGEQRR
ncbi:hypothetical protein D3C80_1431740 [compost metagenome]